MIGINQVSDSSSILGYSAAVKNEQAAPAAKSYGPSASTVVELSGSVGDIKSSERREVSRENAQQMAFDIAAMLPGSMGVQSNISAFDAARLLAD